VAFAGRPESMESRLANERGVEFHQLEAEPLVGGSALARVRSLVLLLFSSLAARRLIKRLMPSAVLGTGGFVSAPTVLGARLVGVPILLVEPNAQVGVANRLLSRFADVAAISFERAAGQLKCPSFASGVPVRERFFELRHKAESESPSGLLLLGGSQGSLVLNRSLPGALCYFAEAARSSGLRLRVLHQAGGPHVATTRAAYCAAFECQDEQLEVTLEERGLEVRIVPFIDDVPAAFADTDVLVSRAGAITLAEICAAGRASILVPLELAGGHQGENARAMVDAGAARLVSEASLAGDALGVCLTELMLEPEKLRRLADNAARLARPDSSRLIADRVEQLAHQQREVAA
jgi:UDP-N-acetylglucosamine--N-acetylmuramyl-(pentapeptide) pyrophosphoryl-undecaprenol N-acetylglucosamine transferase